MIIVLSMIAGAALWTAICLLTGWVEFEGE
jgi:hypothetical protein